MANPAYLAAQRGDIDSLIDYFNDGFNDMNGVLHLAARNGHMDIVQLMLDIDADEIEPALTYAASGGHTDIVNLLLNLGAENYHSALISSARNGHLDVVYLMLELGADNYDNALSIAYDQDTADLINAFKYDDEDLKQYFRAVSAQEYLRKKHAKMAQRHWEKYEAHRLAPKLSEDIVYRNISKFL